MQRNNTCITNDTLWWTRRQTLPAEMAAHTLSDSSTTEHWK